MSRGKYPSKSLAVLGLGMLGSHIALALAKECAKRIVIVDRDFVEPKNIPVQAYGQSDIGLPKADAMRRRIREAAPWCDVQAYACDIKQMDLTALLSECDLAVVCLDNIGSRLEAAEAAARAGTTVIDVGCEGSSGQVLVTEWGRTACLMCLGIGGEEYVTCPVVGRISAAAVASGLVVECAKAVMGDGIRFSLITFDVEHFRLEASIISCNQGCPAIHGINKEHR